MTTFAYCTVCTSLHLDHRREQPGPPPHVCPMCGGELWTPRDPRATEAAYRLGDTKAVALLLAAEHEEACR